MWGKSSLIGQFLPSGKTFGQLHVVRVFTTRLHALRIAEPMNSQYWYHPYANVQWAIY